MEMETVAVESDHENEYDAEMLWKDAGQPLIVTMKIFGLYHEETSEKELESRSLLQKLECLVLKIYHLLIVGFLWLNLIRCLASFYDHQSIVYNILPYASWLFYAASNGTVLFKICYKRDIIKMIAHQSKSCLALQRSGGSMRHDLNLEWRKSRSFAVVGVIVGIIFMCFNMGLVGYNAVMSKSDKYECLPWNSPVVCGLLRALEVYATAALILPVALFAFICRILAGQLNELRKAFRRTFDKQAAITAESVDLYRRHFLILCRSVDMADDIFSPFIAVSYSTNVPIVIFLLYQNSLGYTDSTSLIVMTSVTIISCLVSCAIISIFAVQVHQRVCICLIMDRLNYFPIAFNLIYFHNNGK